MSEDFSLQNFEAGCPANSDDEFFDVLYIAKAQGEQTFMAPGLIDISLCSLRNSVRCTIESANEHENVILDDCTALEITYKSVREIERKKIEQTRAARTKKINETYRRENLHFKLEPNIFFSFYSILKKMDKKICRSLDFEYVVSEKYP